MSYDSHPRTQKAGPNGKEEPIRLTPHRGTKTARRKERELILRTIQEDLIPIIKPFILAGSFSGQRKTVGKSHTPSLVTRRQSKRCCQHSSLPSSQTPKHSCCWRPLDRLLGLTQIGACKRHFAAWHIGPIPRPRRADGDPTDRSLADFSVVDLAVRPLFSVRERLQLLTCLWHARYSSLRPGSCLAPGLRTRSLEVVFHENC
jgi:hypothetical protein